MISLSTRFLGQPKLTKPIFCGFTGTNSFCTAEKARFFSGLPPVNFCWPDGAMVRFFEDMESIQFSILRGTGSMSAIRHVYPASRLLDLM